MTDNWLSQELSNLDVLLIKYIDFRTEQSEKPIVVSHEALDKALSMVRQGVLSPEESLSFTSLKNRMVT